MKKFWNKTKHFVTEHKIGKRISLLALGILAFVMGMSRMGFFGGVFLLGITIGAVKSYRKATKIKASISGYSLAFFSAV